MKFRTEIEVSPFPFSINHNGQALLMGSCFTSNIFYGNEHKRNDQNFSNDIGSTVFMNNSSLIFEEKNGESTISRDGWIKIKSCENGKISGSFKFIIEGEISRKEVKGEFVNVKIEIE